MIDEFILFILVCSMYGFIFWLIEVRNVSK